MGFLKRLLSLVLCIVLCMGSSLVCAQTAALTGVLADDSVLTPGRDWFVEFTAPYAGEAALTLLGGTQGGEDIVVSAVDVDAGEGQIHWDGLLPDGAPTKAGMARLMLTLAGAAGEESVASHMVVVDVLPAGDEAEETLGEVQTGDAGAQEEIAGEDEAEEDATPEEEAAEEKTPAKAAEKKPVPTAANYWEMNPDEYDLKDPEHQKAIWDIMMQEMTVIDKGQRDNVYVTYEPGADLRPRTNISGEFHGSSQGVQVVEDDADGDGYVKITAYSNDGTHIESSHVIGLAAQKTEGYIRKNLLRTVTPSKKYALLVDKLTQTLYIFKNGEIIGELKISTGFNTKEQPYNETPAGEFITVSKVGEFVSGNMFCDLAIRINGGVLLHEVPYKLGTDGVTRHYSTFERYLGQKASHGCVRIQRSTNEEGQNMQWLWRNLENKTKVLIWEDSGREMPPPEFPDEDMELFWNPNGGSSFHTLARCPGVKNRFLPLTGGFTYGDLEKSEYKKLTPCTSCGAPDRKETILENYQKAAEQAGAVIPDDVMGAWDDSSETDQEVE